MSPPTNPATQQTQVLVLGDWVVDENWVLARHRSSLSTMEGRAHLRALGDIGSQVMTFCGAGRVARFLYWMNRFEGLDENRSEKPARWIPVGDRKGYTFSIFGLGTWADEDEPKLYRMFHPRYPDGINPFTLTRALSQEIKREEAPSSLYMKAGHVSYDFLDGLHLCNLAQAYKPRPEHAEWSDVGTTRVYRLYNLQAEFPGGLVLDRRVDFELRFSSSQEEGEPEEGEKKKKDGGRKYDGTQLGKILSTIPLCENPTESGIDIWARNTCKLLSRLRDRIRVETGGIGDEGEEAFETIEKSVRALSKQSGSSQVGPRPPFQYAVVKDLGKGTVTKRLFETLHEKGLVNDQTQWFISSKQLNPSYLTLLTPPYHCGRIRLLFLPPMVVAQMGQDEEEGSRPIHQWFIANKEPTSEALSILKELYKKYHRSQVPTLIVAMPKGLSILGVEGDELDDLVGFNHPTPLLNEIDEELTGRASMFFAALTAQLIREDRQVGAYLEEKKKLTPSQKSEGRCEMIEVALKASYDLVRGNINALKNFGNERGGHRSEDLFSFDPTLESYRREKNVGQNSPVQRVVSFSWMKKNSRWDQSRHNAGIIKLSSSPPGYTLELWRAMGELDGYIETADKRRRSIAQLLSALRDFLHDRPPSSFSAMLIAQPGTGKSYLVSRLAEALGMPHLSFNVTQLVTRESISACFNEIASAQARDRNRVQLVFFDEINAQLASSNVYDLFLTVLEDGTYLRGSQRYKLDPCAWLFAGTRELDGSSEEAFERKEADFKSRLTIDAVPLDQKGVGDSDQRRMLVYQGALQLQSQHTDVKKVSALVLKAFASMELEKGNSRKIRQLAGRFRNIQYGEVRARNLPDELLKALKFGGANAEGDFQSFFPDGYTQTNEELDNILVEIKRQPDRDDYSGDPSVPLSEVPLSVVLEAGKPSSEVL